MKTEILTLNKPNLNGRTYPDYEVAKAISKNNECLLFTEFPSDGRASFADAIGSVRDIHIEGDSLYGDVCFFHGNDSMNSYSVRPQFIGCIKEGCAYDLVLMCCAITNDPA